MKMTDNLPLLILAAIVIVIAAAVGLVLLAGAIAERYGPTAGFVALLLPTAASAALMAIILFRDTKRDNDKGAEY